MVPTQSKVIQTTNRHVTNVWAAVMMTAGLVWLSVAVSTWFLLALIVPALIVWISTIWLVRGGSMLAMVMNKKEQLQEMKSWLDEPTSKVIHERIKDERSSAA